jgi:putative transposase
MISPLYETSLSDAAWELVQAIFSSKSSRGRPRIHDIRFIIDAILYLVKNGCTWRCLPNDFPPWKTVYLYFRAWSISGQWQALSEVLTSVARACDGKALSPTLASVDSQSQSAEPGVDSRGLDGGKKVNGRKRHIVVDTLGLLLICMVTAANEADCNAGKKLVEALKNSKLFSKLKKILGDNSYRGVDEITVEASERKEGQKGFVPQAFRWVVERTFSWFNRQRRLVRNYEKRVLHQESMIYIGNIRTCLKRYEKWVSEFGI